MSAGMEAVSLETVATDLVERHFKLIDRLTEEYRASTDPQRREEIEDRCAVLACNLIKYDVEYASPAFEAAMGDQYVS